MNAVCTRNRQKEIKRFMLSLMFALVLLASLLRPSSSQAADDGTVYVWWLVRWENNQVACSLNIAHTGMPTEAEIENGCGAGLLAQWQNTRTCSVGDTCSGLYLHLAKQINESPNIQGMVYTRPSWLPKTQLVGSTELISHAVDESSLATNEPLQLLAGKLVNSGLVVTDGCVGGGILLTGAATTCGQERAAEVVHEWQNQFDSEILKASEQTQVPPRLLKNLFIQESQMWPSIQRGGTSDEYGLGHMTDAGADTLLTWNRPYYESLCSQMLGPEACADGYLFLKAGERAILRGIVLKQVGADCATCPWHVDLRLAQKSVPIFAHTLVAYAEQTGQLIYNVTERKPSEQAYSEDMWRFTIANYNAGSACLGAALQTTREQKNPLDWVHVAPNFAKGCQQAVTYVNRISNVETDNQTLPPVQTTSIFERWQAAFSPAYVNPLQVNAPVIQVAANYDPNENTGQTNNTGATTPVPTQPPSTPMETPIPGETGPYAFAPMPTPTVLAPVPTSAPSADDPHVDYNATTASCAACHRGHNAENTVLRQQAPEEETCFACHTSGGTGTDTEAAFTQTNTSTRIFEHDIYATNDVHTLFENTGIDFGGTNRHVECEDCHDPHEATRGTSSAPFLQLEMNEVSGVNPTWTTEGAPASYSWLDNAEREYQVCFKCHSSFTILPSYAPDGWQITDATGNGQYVSDGLAKLTSTNSEQVNDSRDLAQEFNPYHGSFHPVVTQGRNTSIPAGAFVAGWSVTSMVYCSDCHTNANPASDGEGPHGSSLLHLLDGDSNYQTVVDPTVTTYGPNNDELCFKCHVYEVYASDSATNAGLTGFRDSSKGNLHGFHISGEGAFATPCYACHDTHGSEQEHLLNFDTSLVNPNGNNIYNSQTAWAWDGTRGTCFVLCHTAGHGVGRSYTP